LESSAQIVEQIQDTLHTLAQVTGRPALLYAGAAAPSSAAATPFLCGEDFFVLAELVEALPRAGLDLILESQGGTVETVEQIVSFLRLNFSSIRCLIPHLATGAATLLALAADEILLDDRGALGPIDPSVPLRRVRPDGSVAVEYVPASTVLQGFDHAREVLREEGERGLTAFSPLLERYDLHLLEMCRRASELARELARGWLKEYMFAELSPRDATGPIRRIVDRLGKPSEFVSHLRPLGLASLQDCGLQVTDLRPRPELREPVWTLYGLVNLLFERQPGVYKIYATSQSEWRHRGSWSQEGQRVELSLV